MEIMMFRGVKLFWFYRIVSIVFDKSAAAKVQSAGEKMT